MLFDTHAHMDDEAFNTDREELLASLPGQGLSLVMNPGCCLETSRLAVALAEKYPFVYAAVGSHPDVADEVNGHVPSGHVERNLAVMPANVIFHVGLLLHHVNDAADGDHAAVLRNDLRAHALENGQQNPHVGNIRHIFNSAAALYQQCCRQDGHGGVFGAADLDGSVQAVSATDLVFVQRSHLS